MADENTQAQQGEGQEAAQEPQEPVQEPNSEGVGSESHDEERGRHEGTDWKAEARKWESRAKENKSAADELEQLRSERDALSEKVSVFESRDERAEWAREISKDTGVPAEVIRGQTRDEMQSHADDLKSLFDSKPSGPVVPAQGKSGRVNVTDPNREAVRSLFGN